MQASFTIDSWDGTAYDEPADGPPLGRATLTKTYSGGLTGTSTAEMLSAQGDGGAAYLAQERIVGRLGDRSGSFVLQHGASGGSGSEPRQWAFVVPGSGTGELAGLRGEGQLEHGGLALDYEVVTGPPAGPAPGEAAEPATGAAAEPAEGG